MSQMFMQFPLAFAGAFTVMMLLGRLGHAQDQSDFISINCGLQQNSDYTDSTTTIRYTPDTDFIDTGEGRTVSRADDLQRQFSFLRVFPEGIRNCYKIDIKSGQKYLIRASFMYGNYDGEDSLPEFELHLGANFWDYVAFTQMDSHTIKELIHIPMRNYIHVCLVNINKGVPFISTIELRRLPKDSYQTEAGSLALLQRSNMAANDTIYRYPNDNNDRIWYPEFSGDWEELTTLLPISDESPYQLPSVVMSTAATPDSIASKYLNFSWAPKVVDKNASYYIYMHFADFVLLNGSWSRELDITINGELISAPFSPVYLQTTTKNTTVAAERGNYYFSIFSPGISYRSILNAYEIYMTKEFLVLETNQQDVEAITNLKSTYQITKNWQGDPCNPQVYLWEGVACSYPVNNSSRIISLDLSSSGLTGEIADYIANLTMIETLDLSNNKLSGEIPEFLAHMPKLKYLNLNKNELNGSVPVVLATKGDEGLSLSVCENPGLTGQLPCVKKKKNQIVIPVVVSIIVVLLVSSISAAILWKRKTGLAIWKFRRVGGGHDDGGQCDVFLSFRGKDTRKGFTHNLYEALSTEGITTFFDDHKLAIGAEIAPSLLAAIESSKVSVIVFSKNYVSSSWCLDELVKILECKKSKQQVVIPIFYKVEPSTVRHQSDTFALEGLVHNRDKIPTWRAALTEVASLSGVAYQDGPYESDLIKEIVTKISDIVNKEEEKKGAKP
ncbi:probable LRR receptor-like serine/threonine-protein kinase At1g05700 [Argentina anserina]|uniref:probable LRR receptor-like serine/threonine-protein kinase At1g05700 n=1 Tax=Argentina anserina TaxID=57926 RepID=UPI0021767C82|nr:probable LRR receptor-like serine/threonine-protein kinase At1g05700 [Potentilla anserina]